MDTRNTSVCSESVSLTSMTCRNLSSEGGCVACRILQMCCVSSRDTSSRSPSIISSSSRALAAGESSSTGGSRLRGTSGVFLGCLRGGAGSEEVDGDQASTGLFCVYMCKCAVASYSEDRPLKQRSTRAQRRKMAWSSATCDLPPPPTSQESPRHRTSTASPHLSPEERNTEIEMSSRTTASQ